MWMERIAAMSAFFLPGWSRVAPARRVAPGRVATRFADLRAPGASFLSLLREYQRRRRSRGDLSRLNERQLKDIGIARAEAEWEANKPFWIP
jgi:uncharacterized protein YjiS (DUF1127 family)